MVLVGLEDGSLIVPGDDCWAVWKEAGVDDGGVERGGVVSGVLISSGAKVRLLAELRRGF